MRWPFGCGTTDRTPNTPYPIGSTGPHLEPVLPPAQLAFHSASSAPGFTDATSYRPTSHLCSRHRHAAGSRRGLGRRLAKLVDRRDKRQSELVELADGLVDSADSARQAAREIDEYGDPLAESLADKFDRIEPNAIEGRDAAYRERLSRADSKLASAENLLENVRNRIATTDQMAEDLDEYRQRIQTIRSSIEERHDSDWEIPRKAQGQLDDCETDVENVEQLLEKGNSSDPTCGKRKPASRPSTPGWTAPTNSTPSGPAPPRWAGAVW